MRRRTLISAGAGALFLSACGRNTVAPAQSPAVAKTMLGPDPSRPRTLQAAVDGAWRSPADRQRDVWRHPVQTLEFFTVRPGATVVELWAGAGWYTEILAPFLASTGGKLYEAQFQPRPDDPAAQLVIEDFKTRFLGKPSLYGRPELTAFGPTSGALCPPGSADVILCLRNFHNWMGAGLAEKALKDALAALKPGGVFGVEEHRAPDGAAQDTVAADGYVQQRYVVQLAEEAGFKLDAASDINANPADHHDHPFGVWTLPPTRRSSPRGEPANPNFDHSKYDAIGESDRMTLRFRKPA
jgi:predicted methyltransferase